MGRNFILVLKKLLRIILKTVEWGKEEIMHIAYATDDNYAVHTAVSMTTLFESNKNCKEINLHILDTGIKEESKNKLLDIAKKYERNVSFYRVNIEELIGRKIENTYKSISISSYGRIFLSSILPQVNKIIYLDCDSIVTGNLEILWNLEFKEIIAGVLDNCLIEAKERIGIDTNSNYVNAGMLAMKLDKIRENDYQDKMIGFINKFNGNVYHHDQGVINGVFNGNIYILHPKYNVMTPFFDMNVEIIKKLYKTNPYYKQSEIDEAVKNPVFVHFTPSMSKRPWIKNCKHPLQNLYLEALQTTPWRDTKLIKDNRKMRIRILEFIYNYLPFFVYYLVVRIVRKC